MARYADGLYVDNFLALVGVDFKIKTIDIQSDHDPDPKAARWGKS